MSDFNPILDTDSYKMLSHFNMLPPDVTRVHSYAESRGGYYPETVFFGLQPWLLKLEENPITIDMVEEAEQISCAHGGSFNSEGWRIIANELRGRLPISINAVPEGTIVPTRNALVTMENTDDRFPWLPGYLETPMLRQVWYGTTVATRIHFMKQKIRESFELTADAGYDLSFALLDFSSRGCASYGANELGGAAYLLSFMGTDSVPALRFTMENYLTSMPGFSVPATEHSIMCSWGEGNEREAIKTMIDRFGGPGKIVSIVADTWDVFRAAGYCADMADYIKLSGTTLVFRPDSGTPKSVLPRVLRILEDGFGSTLNSKSYFVLNGVKVLWGDGIDEYTCIDPFLVAAQDRISASSIMVGSGGGLMQSGITRDTCKFAFKASAVKRGVEGWEGIAKDPITDPGKRSKKGRLRLVKTDGEFHTEPYEDGRTNELRNVFRDGYAYNADPLGAIRERLDSQR